jgi:chromosome segregation ATPase
MEMSKEWLNFIAAIAWPLVALAGLAYVWRKNAIGELLKVKQAVDEFEPMLAKLQDAQEKIDAGAALLSSVTTELERVNDRISEMQRDVEGIRDTVDQKAETPTATASATPKVQQTLRKAFDEMENEWGKLIKALEDKFGPFDKRSTAAAAYRFAHGNRKLWRLDYEDAEEIGRLHSDMKSYRRRQSNLDDWLDSDVKDRFVADAERMTDVLNNLSPRQTVE